MGCCGHFFFPANGLKPPPRPGSFPPPPRPGNCGGKLKAPGGGAAGMPGGPEGAPGRPAPPSCFCIASICSGDGIGMPPPRPIIWPSLPIMPRLAPPPPMAFIMSAIWRCCFRSRLTYSTVTPEPAAMRFLREALRMSGLRRSCGVIDEMMALALDELVIEIGGIELIFDLGDAGQHAHDAAHTA